MTMIPLNPYNTIPTGWLCPRCNRVNSPTSAQCTCASESYPLLPVIPYGPVTWGEGTAISPTPPFTVTTTGDQDSPT